MLAWFSGGKDGEYFPQSATPKPQQPKEGRSSPSDAKQPAQAAPEAAAEEEQETVVEGDLQIGVSGVGAEALGADGVTDEIERSIRVAILAIATDAEPPLTARAAALEAARAAKHAELWARRATARAHKLVRLERAEPQLVLASARASTVQYSTVPVQYDWSAQSRSSCSPPPGPAGGGVVGVGASGGGWGRVMERRMAAGPTRHIPSGGHTPEPSVT